MSFCEACFEKQQENDRLRTENEYLRSKLLNQVRNAKEKPFGVNTPSSKTNHKPNSNPEKTKKQGGAKNGHTGHGRCCDGLPDKTIEVPFPEKCDCGCILQQHDEVMRTVKDMPIVKVEIVQYRIKRGFCPKCQKNVVSRKLPALSRSLLGNQLLSHIADQHYLQGMPLNRLAKQLGINLSTLLSSLHRLRELFKPAMSHLLADYQCSPVKHADETGWRNNGHNGYAWLFSSKDTALFRLRMTRSGSVAQEVLGNKPLPGVLVVDRYQGYNKAPCEIQYCQAHLLRDVQALGKEFPEQSEVQSFVNTAAELLAQTMKLRSLPITDEAYLFQAKELQSKIEAMMKAEAKHPGIQRIQDIYRKHANRMYHWAKDRSVPADNNFAERSLRGLVIARKVSFGSQSDEGALTRETLMSILHTLKLRGLHVRERFKTTLDALAANPQTDIYSLLFST